MKLKAPTVLLATLSVAAPWSARAQQNTSSNKVAAGVYQQYSARNQITFWVFLKDRANLSGAQTMQTRVAKATHVRSRLRAHADQSQRRLRRELRARGVVHKTFWIANAIKVTADRATMEALAAHSEVDRIIADGEFTVPTPQPGAPSINAVDWNIARIGADQVWSNFGDIGQGIVVANIDTGVDATHEALAANYRGNIGGSLVQDYNFFDPHNICGPNGSIPCDTHGHGTHTMGTMAGGDGPGPFESDIGVAPGAQWITAIGCPNGGCPFDALLSSGEWILAPTDAQGNNPDPSRAPHIVNNSWGGGGGDPFYQDIVQAWVAAGIFPAFSNGNSGSSCNSSGSPGDYPEAFSAGATDIGDTIAFFSSRGPSAFGPGKPDISAPGVDVVSSIPGGYGAFSGTSMASPHVAGTVALIWAAAPGLVGDIAGTAAILRSSASDIIDMQCGGDADGDPNNVYGDGLLNAFAAVNLAPRIAGTLEGVVTDASTGAGVAGARVRAVREDDGAERIATTDASGYYQMFLPVDPAPGPELYTVSASSFGYSGAPVNGVQIIQDTTTTQNLALSSAPRHTVSGHVSSTTGQPISGATVAILNTPITPVSTDASGYYTIPNVPAGSYTMRASAGRCTDPSGASIDVNGDTIQNFALPARVDEFGYRCEIDPSFGYVPATQPTGLVGDETSVELTLPFAFTLYGETYTRAFIGDNGVLSFTGRFLPYYNSSIPSISEPNAAIYPFWDDLLIDFFASAVSTETLGSAPNRTFVIEYRDVYFYYGGGPITFEFKLNEVDNSIEFLYYSQFGNGDGRSATIGIENAGGTIAFQYSSDEPTISDGLAIRFVPPPQGRVEGVVTDAAGGRLLAGATVTALEAGRSVETDAEGAYTLVLQPGVHTLAVTLPGYNQEQATVNVIENASVTQNFVMRSPRASLSPASVDLLLEIGETRTRTVRLSNIGYADLTFSSGEQLVQGGALSLPPAASTPDAAPTGYVQSGPPASLAGGPVLVLMDYYPWGSDAMFQVLTANGIAYDVAGSTQMAGLDLSGYDLVYISNDQPQWFYDAYETAFPLFDQYVAGGGKLWVGASAWGWNGGDFTNGRLPGGASVSTFELEDRNTIVDAAHPMVQGLQNPFGTFDTSLSSIDNLPSGARVIARGTASDDPTLVEYNYGAGAVIASTQPLEYYYLRGEVGRILENGVPYAYALTPFVEIPWLSMTPSSGTVAPGASRNLSVTVDTTGLSAGVYRARIALITNDPQQPIILVPVTVLVSAYRVGVNSGGARYVDALGDVWRADRLANATRWGYTASNSTVDTTNHNIIGTTEDDLYQDLRKDAGGYRFPNVPNGTYQVELLFAEFENIQPNRRVFDVYIENQLVLPAFDPINDAGRWVANAKQYFVTVTDGTLNVQLLSRRGYRVPIINAVRVTQRPDR